MRRHLSEWRPSDQPRPERLPSLDGLRGFAALVVLTHHVVMAGVPLLAAAYVAGSHAAAPGWA